MATVDNARAAALRDAAVCHCGHGEGWHHSLRGDQGSRCRFPGCDCRALNMPMESIRLHAEAERELRALRSEGRHA